MSLGIVKEVIGAVVDISFPPGQLPEIYNALKINSADQDTEESRGLKINITLDVALSSSDCLHRGV